MNQQSTDFPGHWPGENHEWDLDYFKEVCAIDYLPSIAGAAITRCGSADTV